MKTHIDDLAVREETDRVFHVAIAKASGNGSLELVVEGLWNQRAELWGRLQQHFHTDDLASKTLRDHDAILAAISAHDPEAARAAMHRHLGRVIKEFERGVDGTTVEPPTPAARKPRPARAPK